MRRVTFDLDVLRTFVTGMELGSFAKAAQRLGRSTSAVSAQLKKLEDQSGAPLLRKEGRGLALTEAGETMLAYARRLIDLNDEAALALGALDLGGRVRLGVQEDFGETALPQVLNRFSRAHPRVRIEAMIARNGELQERITAGQLDLAVIWGDADRGLMGERITELPMCWIGPEDGALPHRWAGEPLPLVLFEPPCLFRSAATQALDQAGISWRVTFTSPSLAGVWAATAAGLGVTLRTPLGLRSALTVLGADHGLPLPMPAIALTLVRAEADLTPQVTQLAQMLRAVLSGAYLPDASQQVPARTPMM